VSSAASVASASATTSPAIRRAWSANHSWDPLAAIVVPSIEITPTLTGFLGASLGL
jgi:hypothetical protein